MVLAVEFDGNLCFKTNKVNDVPIDRMLPSEFSPNEPIASNGAPKKIFSRGRSASQVSSSLLRKFIGLAVYSLHSGFLRYNALLNRLALRPLTLTLSPSTGRGDCHRTTPIPRRYVLCKGIESLLSRLCGWSRTFYEIGGGIFSRFGVGRFSLGEKFNGV